MLHLLDAESLRDTLNFFCIILNLNFETEVTPCRVTPGSEANSKTHCGSKIKPGIRPDIASTEVTVTLHLHSSRAVKTHCGSKIKTGIRIEPRLSTESISFGSLSPILEPFMLMYSLFYVLYFLNVFLPHTMHDMLVHPKLLYYA